jgi:hypothetical protein
MCVCVGVVCGCGVWVCVCACVCVCVCVCVWVLCVRVCVCVPEQKDPDQKEREQKKKWRCVNISAHGQAVPPEMLAQLVDNGDGTGATRESGTAWQARFSGPRPVASSSSSQPGPAHYSVYWCYPPHPSYSPQPLSGHALVN